MVLDYKKQCPFNWGHIQVGDIDLVPDLPHALDKQLRYRCSAEPICAVDANTTIYEFSTLHEEYDSSWQLNRIVVCDKPLKFSLFGKSYSPNSGSHRVLFDSSFLGERVMIAVEERENIACRFKGDAILIGVEPCGLVGKMAKEMGEVFATAVLSNLIYNAIGHRPMLINGMPWQERDPDLGDPWGPVYYDKDRKRFEINIVDVNTIIEGGCNLYSPQAKGCFLFLFQ